MRLIYAEIVWLHEEKQMNWENNRWLTYSYVEDRKSIENLVYNLWNSHFSTVEYVVEHHVHLPVKSIRYKSIPDHVLLDLNDRNIATFVHR